MARARNIKPGFFINEELSENDPLGRILFIGLWTIADFKGDLEWKPKRIKAQILPYDNCDIEELMNNLDKSRLVTYYSVSGNFYIHINNFEVHQNPHPNERKAGSKIPSYKVDESQSIDNKEEMICNDKSRPVTSQSPTSNADSLIPITDSLIPHTSEKKVSKKKPVFCPPTLDEIKEYIKTRQSDVDPKKFFDYFEAGNWVDGKGQKVKSWKQKIITWEGRGQTSQQSSAPKRKELPIG